MTKKYQKKLGENKQVCEKYVYLSNRERIKTFLGDTKN